MSQTPEQLLQKIRKVTDDLVESEGLVLTKDEYNLLLLAVTVGFREGLDHVREIHQQILDNQK